MFLNLHAVTNSRVVSQWGMAADWMAEDRFPAGEGAFRFVTRTDWLWSPAGCVLKLSGRIQRGKAAWIIS